jgi:hypothetical protein
MDQDGSLIYLVKNHPLLYHNGCPLYTTKVTVEDITLSFRRFGRPDISPAQLVTEFFPYPWMGGNRAIRQRTHLAETKGTTVRGAGVINWSRKRREAQIVEVTERLSELF